MSGKPYVLAACLCVASLPAGAGPPSFDCKKARLPAEIQICAVPRLAELDSLIGAGYNFLKSSRGRQYADSVGVQFWIRRNNCESDQHCIENVQIEAIEAYESSGAPISLPAWITKGRPKIRKSLHKKELLKVVSNSAISLNTT